MKKLLLPALGALVVAAALVTYFNFRGADTVSASQVVTRMQAATARLATSVGPNTTFHQRVVHHVPKVVPTQDFALAAEYNHDIWVAFGSDGVATKFLGEDSGLDSTLYQTVVMDGQQLVDTDVATGHIKTTPSGPITAQSLVSTLSSAAIDTSALVNGSAAAPQADVSGKPAFVVIVQEQGHSERFSIDKEAYRVVKIERIATDAGGNETVVETWEFPVLEILPGDAIPAASQQPASVPAVTPAATSPPPEPAATGPSGN